MDVETKSPPKYPEFGAKLRSARLRSGKSQERIAAEVGTSRRHWIRWEMGYTFPSGEFLARIGEATGQPETFAPVAASDDDEEDSQPMPREVITGLMDAVRYIVRAEMSGRDQVRS